MKKLSRIIMLVVLALVMLIPTACTITPEKSANGIVFELDLLTNTYVVVDYKAAEDDVVIEGNKILVKEVVIPSTFNGRPVSKISTGAFRQRYTENRHDYAEYFDFTRGQITEATLRDPKSNVDLAYYAKVQKVVIPSSVKVIGDYAFQNATELKEVVMDNGVNVIGNSAFAGCATLDTITLTENGEKMSGVETNQLPANINQVNDGAFFQCYALEEVYLPANVKQIGKLSFASCSSLKSVRLEKNDGSNGVFDMVGTDVAVLDAEKTGTAISSIGNYAFKDSIAMKYFNVPNSVNKFGVAVFEMPEVKGAEIATKGSKLEGVSFSENIKALGAGMFKNCVSLDEDLLDLSNIEEIGDGIFEGCTSLKSVQLNGKISKIPARAYYGCTGIETIDLTVYMEDGVEKPTKINYIGEAAFRGCSSLRSIELGSDSTSLIKEIKRNAFKDCAQLRSIYIPTTVIKIDPRVFENSGSTVIYYKRNKVVVPEGEQSVIAPGFENGSANAIFDFEDLVKVEENGEVIAEYITKKVGNNFEAYLARYVSDNSTYSIPNTINDGTKDLPVVSVLKAAFKNCVELERVEFAQNSGVKALEAEAFSYATALTDIDLSTTQITSISEKAFAYSVSLESIEISSKVTAVENSAFEGCIALANIDLSTVTSLGKAVFKDCSNLVSVKFGAINNIPEQTFYNAKKLNSIIVENIAKINNIKERAFYGCESLNENNFPTSALTALTTIGNEAFYGCSGYTTIGIPKTLTKIGSKAFAGCTKLASFSIAEGNKTFFVDDTNVLYEKKTKAINITYFATKADYESANYWSNRKTMTVSDAYYYSNLVYYPANSDSKELFVDMKNTYTYGQLLDFAKAHNGGTPVYALTSSTFGPTFATGQNYYTDEGKIYNVTKKAKTFVNDFTGDETFVVGKLGASTIADYAFEGAINLEKVEVYGNVTIGIGAFNNCPKLETISVLYTDNGDSYANNNDGILYKGSYKDGIFVPTQIVQFPANYEVDVYEMPNTITTLGPNAFAGVKRIGTLVLSDNLGWSSEEHNVNRAFNASNIGKFEIKAKAAWVTTVSEEGKQNHSLALYTPEVETERDLFENSNGKFMIDNYGILYSVSIGTEQYTVDGKTITNSFLKYDQLIYVPTDVDLSEKALTIPNACTVGANAFSGNSTLKTIILGKKISMVANSFANCANLEIYYLGSRIDFEDAGYLDDVNYKDNNGYATNDAFATAISDSKIYYYSRDMVGESEYVFWHYKSGLDEQTQAPLTYDSAVDPAVPDALNGSPVIYQDNDLLENYGYQYQLAKDSEGMYYQNDAGAWVIETNNFGEQQFIIDFWNK